MIARTMAALILLAISATRAETDTDEASMLARMRAFVDERHGEALRANGVTLEPLGVFDHGDGRWEGAFTLRVDGAPWLDDRVHVVATAAGEAWQLEETALRLRCLVEPGGCRFPTTRERLDRILELHGVAPGDTTIVRLMATGCRPTSYWWRVSLRTYDRGNPRSYTSREMDVDAQTGRLSSSCTSRTENGVTSSDCSHPEELTGLLVRSSCFGAEWEVDTGYDHVILRGLPPRRSMASRRICVAVEFTGTRDDCEGRRVAEVVGAWGAH